MSRKYLLICIFFFIILFLNAKPSNFSNKFINARTLFNQKKYILAAQTFENAAELTNNLTEKYKSLYNSALSYKEAGLTEKKNATEYFIKSITNFQKAFTFAVNIEDKKRIYERLTDALNLPIVANKDNITKLSEIIIFYKNNLNEFENKTLIKEKLNLLEKLSAVFFAIVKE